MTFWILPSNEDTFRLSDFLKVSHLVDWRQHNNFNVGDIIFIYNSRPLHRITHKMIVERVNVPSSEYLNDRKYWTDIKECEEGLRQNRYVRLRYVVAAPEDSKLDFDTLRNKGLKANLQGAAKVSDNKLLYYIRTQMQPDTDEKIARICWNSNSWETPSGELGKSTTAGLYETDHGYGHEEWLLDRKRICDDGYHYAFLEPLRKDRGFEGTKTIHLYTYTPESKKQYIGCIRDAEYVSDTEADVVWKEYVSKGWAKEMVNELKTVGIIVSASDLKSHFNIRFKFENYVDYSQKNLYLTKDNFNTQNKHYKFLNLREPFEFEENIPELTDNDSEAIVDPNNSIPEGAKSRVTVNRYERSKTAREECIAAYNNEYRCVVCGINFEEVYGSIGKEFIHVHHVKPISEIGSEYKVNPKTDLVPVCPNCHAMLHKGIDGKVLTVEELRKKIRKIGCYS